MAAGGGASNTVLIENSEAQRAGAGDATDSEFVRNPGCLAESAPPIGIVFSAPVLLPRGKTFTPAINGDGSQRFAYG